MNEQKHKCLNTDCHYHDETAYRHCDKDTDVYDCDGAHLVKMELCELKETFVINHPGDRHEC